MATMHPFLKHILKKITINELLEVEEPPSSLFFIVLKHEILTDDLIELCSILAQLPDVTVDGLSLDKAPIIVLFERELRVTFTLPKFANYWYRQETRVHVPKDEVQQLLHILQQRCNGLLMEGQVMRVRVHAEIDVHFGSTHHVLGVYGGYDGTNPLIWIDNDQVLDYPPLLPCTHVSFGMMERVNGGYMFKSDADWDYSGCMPSCLRIASDTVLVQGFSSVTLELLLRDGHVQVLCQLPLTFGSIVDVVKYVLSERINLSNGHQMRLKLTHSARNFDLYQLLLE